MQVDPLIAVVRVMLFAAVTCWLMERKRLGGEKQEPFLLTRRPEEAPDWFPDLSQVTE